MRFYVAFIVSQIYSPNFPLREYGPSKRATAMYPSKGPAGELKGLAWTVFIDDSSAGKTASANAREDGPLKSEMVHIAFPVREQKALRIPGFTLPISLVIRTKVSLGMVTPSLRHSVRWGVNALARVDMTASCVSFARSGEADCMMRADIEAEGDKYPSIVYRALRWSGPAVFPAFGRLRISSTVDKSKEGS